MIWMATALALDLDAARERATAHAIAVEQAAAAARAAQGERWRATAGALPRVSLFGSASTGQGLTSFGFERPVQLQMALGANASWALIAPSAWAASHAAHHSALGQRSLLAWARVTARRDATVAFAEVWAAQEQARAWRDALADAEAALDGVLSLTSAGLRPSADAARMRATTATLRATTLEAEAAAVARCAELHALLREDVTAPCALTPPAGEVTPGEADGPHPALVATEEALRAARASRASVVLGLAPTLAATGTIGQYTADERKGVGWSAGVEAQLPVFGGGEAAGSIRAATAARDDAALALEEQQLALGAAVRAAEARYQAARAGLEALQQAAAAADEGLALTDARYRQGLDGLEAWLAARRERDEARVALARGRAVVLTSLAELEAARGVW